MRVFVLGGTGFIGSHIVKSLVHSGHAVSALARGEEKAAYLKRIGAIPLYGDLNRRESLLGAVRGADVVVNAAFPYFLGRMDMKRVQRDAQEGLAQMQNLLETVAAVGNIPVILTEGSMAYGDSGGGWLDENAPYTFDKGHGRLLKLSVPYARRMAEDHKMSIITMSVSGAYGPGTWFKESIYAYLKKGLGMVVGTGQNVWSFVHVEDIAEAYRLAVEKLPVGQTFTLADDEPCTFLDFANYTAQQMGKPPVRRMPKPVASLFLGSVLVEALTMNQRVKNTLAKIELGWKPRYASYRKGVPAALAALDPALYLGKNTPAAYPG